MRHFIIHARKCHLRGLSPAQNRNVPPLHHSWVYALKRDFPHLEFTLNGGIRSLLEVKRALDTEIEGAKLAGVMVGRGINANPVGMLGNADTLIFGASSDPCVSRRQLLDSYVIGCEGIIADLRVRQIMPPKLRA